MMGQLVIGFLLVLVTVVHGRHEKYEGHQLFKIRGAGQDIQHLETKLDILSTTPAARSASGQLEAIVRLAPEDRDEWLPYFEGKGMQFTMIADDLAKILREEDSHIRTARDAAARDGQRRNPFDNYYNHDEINEFLDDLAVRHPNLVTIINGALSYEGRQIKYARISTTNFNNVQKPVILIDAMMHAREWVTTPVAMYIIEQLVNGNIDPIVRDSVDWIIVPIANPDGYEYTIHEDRLWRKTRSRSHANSDACPGVDGNRNYDHEWGTTASAADPCAITYEGPSPFSEPETALIRNIVYQYQSRIAMYISLHSYGNMFLYAWGNNGTLPSNGLTLHLAGVTMASAIDRLAAPGSPLYVVGNAAQVLYYSTGTSRDWTRAAGIPLTYTLELPGYHYEFIVPPTYIEQINKETWEGIEAGARYILSV